MIEMATVAGLKTMLGCMIESSIGVTAAAHLSPLVDLRRPGRKPLIATTPTTA